MNWLIWSGAALTVIGLIGIIWSVILVIKARRANSNDDALRAAMARIVPVNFGALMVSVLGLIMVVMGTKVLG